MTPLGGYALPSMTIWDEYFKCALHSLLSFERSEPPDWLDVNDPPGSFAKRAAQYADAMLQERNKREQQ